LGCHSKSKRTQISRRLTTAAAAPALAGVAAVLCMSPQAMASPLASHAATGHAASADAADAASARVGLTPTQLLSAARQAVASVSAQPAKYTVREGDSLSAIAGRVYHDRAAWPAIYWANHSKVRWANEISVGQVLKIPAKPARTPAAPGQLGPGAGAPVAAVGTSQVASPAYAPVQTASPAYAPVQTASPAYAPVQTASTYSGNGGFASCVIARESGGNAQVMNSSGHYGLYQFSASTWAAYGGSAGAFGNASVAQQNQVFSNALAAGGQSNWSAYDGC
jgi:LysM repeat protein